jgi:hypothetical protein
MGQLHVILFIGPQKDLKKLFLRISTFSALEYLALTFDIALIYKSNLALASQESGPQATSFEVF